ncbi:MAG: hypothetical protein ACRDIY_15760 [Chloroflexota bacterium]
MKTLTLVRWELVQAIRGLGPQVAVTLASLASVGLIGVGIFLLDLWSPFPTASLSGFRADVPSSEQLSSLLGEYRGGMAFLVLLGWLVLIAALVGPAFSAGAIVRDRRSGRLDRVLTDASRADVVVVAKLFAGLVPLAIVLAAAGPSTSFAWLIGGLATREAIASVAVLVAIVVLVAAVGLACSAVATTEVGALIGSYIVVGGIVLGPLVAGAGLALAGFRSTAAIVVAFDPFVALLSVQTRLTLGLSRTLLADWSPLRVTWTIGRTRVPIWAGDVLLYALLAVGLVWLTSVVIEPLHPVKTWRMRRAQRASR